MRLLSYLFTLFFAAVAMGAAAQERPNTILVLDASGSMWGQIDGVNKIVIAREVVADILSDFPADQNLGLVSYGHRTRGDCSDIETLVAPGTGTAGQISQIVNGLNPRGMTPMTDAVIAAAEALTYTENAATVILVSDGIETCNPDPCAAARALNDAGIDFTAHVVGFDVAGEAEALLQMQCIADATGGMFLTADNAEELSSALETVVMAEPEPEPEPQFASLGLHAVVGSESGPLVETPVIWSIGAPEFGLELDTNPAVADLELGSYEITAYHVVWEQELTQQIALAGEPRDVFFVFTEPTPTATLIAPDSAPAGSRVEVGWNGPNDQNDNIQIAHIDGNYIDYQYTERGNPVTLIMPADPGIYELRYKLRDRDTIATRQITVTPAEIDIIAPESATIGATVEVGWVGPNAPNDNIQIAHIDGGYIDYFYTAHANPGELIMPSVPGDYELRYSFRDNQTIFTRPISVTEAEVTLIAPETAVAGSTIEVGWVGPNAQSDSVDIAHIDGGYIDYFYTSNANPGELIMPAEPGDYVLRYRFRDQETIYSQPITVTPRDVGLIAPQSAPAGSTIEVGWNGPNAQNDSVDVAHIDGGYIDYFYTGHANPGQLILPSTPGEYVLRYRFRDQETIYSQPITVTPAEVNLLAPATALAGSTIEVGWVGPNAQNDSIDVAHIDGSYINYAYTSHGNPVRLQMPDAPGTYVLRYRFRDNETIFSQEITVTPAK